MATLKIRNCAPWDGDYPFDDGYFTMSEFHRIKEISGVRAGELFDAIEAGDTDVHVALGVVIPARQGVRVAVEDLWNAKIGDISFDWGSDAGPPEPPASEQSLPDSPSGEAS